MKFKLFPPFFIHREDTKIWFQPPLHNCKSAAVFDWSAKVFLRNMGQLDQINPNYVS